MLGGRWEESSARFQTRRTRVYASEPMGKLASGAGSES